MHFFKQTFVLDNFYKNCASNSSLLQYIYDLNEKLNSGFGPSSKDLSISLLKLLECRMQWYIDFITWTSRPYFRLITGSSFTVLVLCRLNHIRCIRVCLLYTSICCVKIITSCNINRQRLLSIPCFISYRNPEYTC